MKMAGSLKVIDNPHPNVKPPEGLEILSNSENGEVGRLTVLYTNGEAMLSQRFFDAGHQSHGILENFIRKGFPPTEIGVYPEMGNSGHQQIVTDKPETPKCG